MEFLMPAELGGQQEPASAPNDAPGAIARGFVFAVVITDHNGLDGVDRLEVLDVQDKS